MGNTAASPKSNPFWGFKLREVFSKTDEKYIIYNHMSMIHENEHADRKKEMIAGL